MAKAELSAEKKLKKAKNSKLTKRKLTGRASGMGQPQYYQQLYQAQVLQPYVGYPAKPVYLAGIPLGPCDNCGEFDHSKRTCNK